MLDLFVKERDERPEFFDLSNNLFSDHADDPDLRKAFAEKAQSLRHTPGPRDILLRISATKDRGHRLIYTSFQKLCRPILQEEFSAPDDEHRKIIVELLAFGTLLTKNTSP